MNIKYYLPKDQQNLEQHGAWIDLKTNKAIFEMGDEYKAIPLGLRLKLPQGYEAIVVPRSSTFKRYKVLQVNSMGVIDTEYCGMKDEWHFPAYFADRMKIPIYTRICQFRIQLTQDATFLQKIMWLFSRPKFKRVDLLYGNNRGGFGSSGV